MVRGWYTARRRDPHTTIPARAVAQVARLQGPGANTAGRQRTLLRRWAAKWWGQCPCRHRQPGPAPSPHALMPAPLPAVRLHASCRRRLLLALPVLPLRWHLGPVRERLQLRPLAAATLPAAPLHAARASLSAAPPLPPRTPYHLPLPSHMPRPNALRQWPRLQGPRRMMLALWEAAHTQPLLATKQPPRTRALTNPGHRRAALELWPAVRSRCRETHQHQAIRMRLGTRRLLLERMAHTHRGKMATSAHHAPEVPIEQDRRRANCALRQHAWTLGASHQSRPCADESLT